MLCLVFEIIQSKLSVNDLGRMRLKILFQSGTASYLLGMSGHIAAQADDASNPINVKNLSLGWMIGFLFLVSFVGLFSIVPLRKMMILKYKLTYPSGTATAYLINNFHTPKGAKLAKNLKSAIRLPNWRIEENQSATVRSSSRIRPKCGGSIRFGRFWRIANELINLDAGNNFTNALFQWFFAAADGCGFSNFPTFGLKAFSQRLEILGEMQNMVKEFKNLVF
ncbi:hypothetical protein HYC85_027465 [Camellia sinensis]|uniref:Uncharacterized protein n=1 Tax=Camellia sinensis TaxID=4442 RepID=A0A7J7GAI0_CAMSI|nr:hypothetical protein HYC85_027465 [Camellia sinensis]